MEADARGKLVLQHIPSAEAEGKVIDFLSRYFKSASPERLMALIKKAPVIISKNISPQAGENMAARLRKLGASAEYVLEKNSAADLAPEQSAPAENLGGAPALPSAPVGLPQVARKHWKNSFLRSLQELNKELWLIISMIIIVGLMNYLLTAQKMLLGLYFLPTIFSAYYYGRRHATLTAVASILLVVLIVHHNPHLLSEQSAVSLPGGQWFELVPWGSILIITAYTMGTLYEQNSRKIRELRKTYHGLIMILRHFISKDTYTENHCYRVSVYAAKIAAYLNLSTSQIEDIRAASMLHDLGKLDISRDLLYKAAQLTREEFSTMKKHVDHGVEMLETVSSPLGRILPIILAHHEKYDGTGYYKATGETIPLESRIISVADVYDALTSDRPYRKAMSPFDAKSAIEKGAGTDFDPKVVRAFLKAFKNGEMDVPNVVI